MRIIFIDNSINFTASSLNLKALDSLQKILINFSLELARNNHEIIFYNKIEKDKKEEGVSWKQIKNLKSDSSDILIAVQDIDLLEYKIKSKIKFLLLHYKIDNQINKDTLIKIFKQKICLLYTNNYVVNALPKNYQYVPKVHLKIGVDKSFIESRNVGLNNSNVFVTTHPLKGIDWLVELWLELIHHKLPWVELHIYSKLLGSNISTNNLKIRNIKLTLELNKGTGICVKEPLPQEKFISQLTQYKLHLCPSLDNDIQYLSILESQAFGVPVIARETATIYDCIYHNETGYIVKDKKTFAKRIIQVLSDNKLFLTLRNNSKLNNYIIPWEDVVKNFERKVSESTFYR